MNVGSVSQTQLEMAVRVQKKAQDITQKQGEQAVQLIQGAAAPRSPQASAGGLHVVA